MNKNLILIVTLLIVSLASYLLFKDDTKESMVKKEDVLTPLRVEKSEESNDALLEEQALIPSKSKKTTALSLDLELFSTVPGKTKKSGYAFISYNKAPQQLYIVGSSFGEGVLLKEVAKNYIIMDNKGILEKITRTKNTPTQQLTAPTIRSEKTTSALLAPVVSTNKPAKIVPKPRYDKDALPPMDSAPPPSAPSAPSLPPLPKLEPITLEQDNEPPPPSDDGIGPPLD